MFKANADTSFQTATPAHEQLTILRLPAVRARSGYSRSTVYLRVAQGLWTKQISLGPRAIGWPADEVTALNAARIASKSEAEIRELVNQLHAKRAVAAE